MDYSKGDDQMKNLLVYGLLAVAGVLTVALIKVFL